MLDYHLGADNQLLEVASASNNKGVKYE